MSTTGLSADTHIGADRRRWWALGPIAAAQFTVTAGAVIVTRPYGRLIQLKLGSPGNPAIWPA